MVSSASPQWFNQYPEYLPHLSQEDCAASLNGRQGMNWAYSNLASNFDTNEAQLLEKLILCYIVE
jgi:hypothetical protein